MISLFYLWVISKTIFCGCGPDKRRHNFDKFRSKYTIDKIGFLPVEITESSGIESAADTSEFWMHNDSGSPSELYRVDLKGHLKSILRLPDIPNKDWEDLASDASGRLYIGDFGNNSNNRRDLGIYVLPTGWEKGVEKYQIGHITFQYGTQKEFPASKKTRNFDAEGFFFYQDSLYLFSKNTGTRPRYTTLYKIPARPGNYTIFPYDSIRLNETITAADISPDESRFALLSYGKIFVFDTSAGKIDFSNPLFCIKKFRGQTEAILMKSNSRMLISNEKGRLFEVRPK